MAARLVEIVDRLRTAPGRKRLLHGAFFRTWRVLFPIARAYRHTLIHRTRVVAVVGSFGKTTTTRAVCAALDLPIRFPSGWNSGSFLAAGLLRIHPGARYAALEVGISRKGMMARCARLIGPDIAVVTSIGSEHHQSLGTIEETRSEKADMVRALPSSGLAVLNGDDPNAVWMRNAASARVITFGLSDACDVRASSVALDIRTGMRFTLHVGGATCEMTSHLVGSHMVYSILAAVAVAIGEGLPLEGALARLRNVGPSPERLEVVPTEGGAFLLVDTYKSILETIVASLETLAALHADQKIVVLGDIEEPKGSQGPLYRDLGAHLARIATQVVFVGGEKAYRSLARGARDAGMPREHIAYAGRSPQRAAELVQENLRAGDIVLVKGRSTQQLERVAFHLTGRPMPCDIWSCGLRPGCAQCPVTKSSRRRA